MNTTRPVYKFIDLIKTHWSLLLILSTAFLFATKTSFNIPFYIMAAIGLYRLIKNNDSHRVPEIRFIYILFFSIWLPMLFSLTDAVDLHHSLKTTLPYLRFLFAAVFIIEEVKKNDAFNHIVLGIAIIISFWCLDALFQFIVGVDMFGYPMRGNFVGGLFSPKGTLGHVLAILSPVYFEIVRRYHSRHRYLWLLLLIFFSIVLLSGKRTAWMMLFTSCTFYGAYLFYLYRSAALKIFLVIIPIAVLIMGLLVTQYQPLNTKINKTLGLFSVDYEQMDKATARQLSLWETGIKIYGAHWINGIGPRGFRHVYADYANTDNFFITNGYSGQTHPHLTLLEIVIETGSLGLFGYLIFWLYLMRFASQLIKENKACHLPWLMCIMIAVLPYNAGSAFYGSYWSSLTWWIILISACFVFSSQNKGI